MRRSRLLPLVLFAVCACAHASAPPVASAPARSLPADEPRLWDPVGMARVKARIAAKDPALEELAHRIKHDGDQALTAGPFSVTQKRVLPASHDPHDYLSIAPYWWPDPTRPQGLPYVQRDGERNPDRTSDDTDARRESAMADAVRALALAYFITDDEAYAQRAALLLRTWFLDPTTRMNPKLEFAQAVPGRANGRPQGLIDTVDMIPMLDGVALLSRSPAWTAADRAGLVAWFEQYLHWLRTSPLGLDEEAATNNHGAWYDVQVCRYALFVGQTEVARQVAERAKKRRIAAQIQPDGNQPEELRRTRSFHYSIYSLSALFDVATMAEPLGVHLFDFVTPDGRSLRKALDALAPYADEHLTWPHAEMDRRARNGLVPLLRRAARVYREPRYEEIIERQFGDSVRRNPLELVLPKS